MPDPSGEILKLLTMSHKLYAKNLLLPAWIVAEILDYKKIVEEWIPVEASGSAVCRYTIENGVPTNRHYIVRYQPGDLGNIIHELTHVAVNETYKRDFINYTVLPQQCRQAMARVFTQNGFCENEAARQGNMLIDTEIDTISTRLNSLKACFASTSLSAKKKKLIDDKLTYGTMNPHLEYHTVINQIYIWLIEWKCNQKIKNVIETTVLNLHLERKQTKLTETWMGVT